MPKKKDRNGAAKQNDNTNKQSNNSLFSGVDAKSVDVSGYTLGHGAPQINESRYIHSVPTGVGKLCLI